MHNSGKCLTALRGLVALSFFLISGADIPAQRARNSVPLCRGITLSASYLAETGFGEGQGFQFSLANHTSRKIRLLEPVPSSSHWYALTRGKWLWRASNGAGGSLLDATREKGRVLVYPLTPNWGRGGAGRGIPRRYFTVQPHQTRTWVANERENPVLEYKPRCPKCSYPGEREYQVVFAYAYLPAGKDAEGLLSCGIRSDPVPMPPKR